jgi:4'-phosphopantetheinyl transferase
VQQLAQTLSEEEHRKAKCFHFEQDRKRFIVGRGVLRTILGLYLGVEPSLLRFCYNSHGKPYLADRFGGGALQFNLSHSHELALYAFTRGREIGVDLEYIRYIPDAEQIAASFFSARENTVLHTLPTSQKQETFFNCWTRKEAYIKAIGNGLAQPLDKFDVSLAPGEPARLLSVDGAPEEASRWSLKALTPAPGYVAALAVEGHNWSLTYWQFPEAT